MIWRAKSYEEIIVYMYYMVMKNSGKGQKGKEIRKWKEPSEYRRSSSWNPHWARSDSPNDSISDRCAKNHRAVYEVIHY